MKTFTWALLWAFLVSVVGPERWVPVARANSVGIGNNMIGSNPTDTSGKPTNAVTSGTPKKAVSTPVKQYDSEKQAEQLNNNGSNAASGLGMAAIAAGMAMIAAGTALLAFPPTAPAGAALIAAGIALLMSGMKALKAADKMNNNAGTAAGHAESLTPIVKDTRPDGANTGAGSADGGIKIDPALARNGGKIDSILDDFEQKTGMSRDDLINGLNAGKDPLDMLADSKKVGLSRDELQKFVDKHNAEGGKEPTGEEVMGQLGLTPEDLVANTAGGQSRAPNGSGAGGTDFDSLFGSKGGGDGKGDANANGMGTMGGELSKEVQDALDRNGITSRTIFQMVHSQYQKKAPMMFGVKNNAVPSARPLFDLDGAPPMEF